MDKIEENLISLQMNLSIDTSVVEHKNCHVTLNKKLKNYEYKCTKTNNNNKKTDSTQARSERISVS